MFRLRFLVLLSTAAVAAVLLSCDSNPFRSAPADVASVSIENPPAELVLGDSVRLTAVARDAGGNALSGREVFWASEAEDVATVTENGMVTAVAAGEARIAASAEGASDLATLTVIAAVRSVTVEPAEATTRVGDGVTLEATPRDADGNALANEPIAWSLDDPEVAELETEDGRDTWVVGRSPGTVTVTATSGEGEGSAVVIVGAGGADRLEIVPAEDTLRAIGASVRLEARAVDADGNAAEVSGVEWSSDNEDVAQVSSSGRVTAVASGSVEIRASVNGLTATATIVVLQEAASVSVSPSATTVQVDDTTRLTATARDAEGAAVEGVSFNWRSADEAIATVDGSGLVTGRASGQDTEITAEAEGLDLSGSATVFVQTGDVAELRLVEGDEQSAPAGSPLPNDLTVQALDGSGNAVSGATVVWSTDDGSVSPPRPNTNTSGEASTTWTLGSRAGNQTATASVGGRTVTFSATATAGDPASIEERDGDGQSGTAGERLTRPLVVLVTDANGNPVEGATVEWSGDGSVQRRDGGATNSDGLGRADWTLGGVAGSQSATASVSGGGSVEFSATAQPGEAGTLSLVSGDEQSGTVGETLGDPLVVEASDANDNPVAGVTITWSGDGSFEPATMETGANGRAETEWTLGSTAGTQTATAAASGANPATFEATAEGVPPDAPSNLSAEAEGTDRIDLAWDAASGADTYELERDGDTIETGITGTSFTDTGLDPDTEYTYRVRAFNDAGNSEWSGTASATTDEEEPDPPAAPSNLSADADGTDRIDLSWTSNSDDENGFRIDRRVEGGSFAELTTVDAGTTSYADTGLDPDTEYTYRVRAVNDAGDSDWSDSASATTDEKEEESASAPTASTGTATNVTSTSARFNGTVDPNGADTFIRFDYGQASDLSDAETTGSFPISGDAGETDITSGVIDGLNPATTYYFRIFAENEEGQASGNIESFETAPPLAAEMGSGNLAPATTYYVRAVAGYDGGRIEGSTEAFTARDR